MSTKKKININSLMRSWPDGVIYTQKHLSSLGYYHDLVRRYKKGEWLEPVGRGAYKKAGDRVTIISGLHALQTQLQLAVHPAGRTALAWQGYAHYIRFTEHLFLLGRLGEALPKWFTEAEWETPFLYQRKKLFHDDELGLTHVSRENLELTLPAAERAAMEMCSMIPKYQGVDEAEKIISGLMTLRPTLVQQLLEQCRSVKTKRLFLYFSDRNAMPWFSRLDQKYIDLGSGKRMIVKDGRLDTKYQISLPEVRDQ